MPDITIIMPSYNKEKYIEEALDSVLMQETTYDYHIIVADDCSTDRTVGIVRQYQEDYPGKISLLTSERNQKLYKNVIRAYEITKTDYFCVLDPDDFWIGKQKIQKALDFLERNKDYTSYVSNTAILSKDGSRQAYMKLEGEVDFSFEDLLKNRATFGLTTGTIFRNVIFREGIPKNMRNLACASMEQSFRGDSFRTVIHLHEGKAHCVPEIDAVYRITDEGIWQGSTKLQRDLLNTILFKNLWLYFDKKYPELLVISHKWIDSDSIKSLNAINDVLEQHEIACQLVALNDVYKENARTIIIGNAMLKVQSIMSRIRSSCYKRLGKPVWRIINIFRRKKE